MDVFAVSLGVGTARAATDLRSIFRLSFHFGLFQGLMTFLGWIAGSTISLWISHFDHWLAFILLAFVGMNMIRSGFNHDLDSFPQNPSRGRLLIVLCVATSIDAMAVGLSMGVVETPILWSALIIGAISSGLSYLGLKIGHLLGEKFGKRMEVMGGLILISIGLRILIGHIFNI